MSRRRCPPVGAWTVGRLTRAFRPSLRDWPGGERGRPSGQWTPHPPPLPAARLPSGGTDRADAAGEERLNGACGSGTDRWIAPSGLPLETSRTNRAGKSRARVGLNLDALSAVAPTELSHDQQVGAAVASVHAGVVRSGPGVAWCWRLSRSPASSWRASTSALPGRQGRVGPRVTARQAGRAPRRGVRLSVSKQLMDTGGIRTSGDEGVDSPVNPSAAVVSGPDDPLKPND